MSGNKYTKEKIEFLKEQCEFIGDEYEKIMANLLKIISSIEEDEARERFMNMYNDMLKNEPKKPAFLKTASHRIKNKSHCKAVGFADSLNFRLKS